MYATPVDRLFSRGLRFFLARAAADADLSTDSFSVSFSFAFSFSLCFSFSCKWWTLVTTKAQSVGILQQTCYQQGCVAWLATACERLLQVVKTCYPYVASCLTSLLQPNEIDKFVATCWQLATSLWLFWLGRKAVSHPYFQLMSDHGVQLRWKDHLGANLKAPCQHSPTKETREPRENPRLSGRLKICCLHPITTLVINVKFTKYILIFVDNDSIWRWRLVCWYAVWRFQVSRE